MSVTPIIEVLLTDDGLWNYKLRPSPATVDQYGAILATVTRQLARMFEVEGGFDAAGIQAAIVKAYNKEIETPGAVATMAMLQ